MLGAKMRQGVPTGFEKHEHRADVMAGRDGQELVDALLEADGVLLPEKVVEKDAHGVHAEGFGPGQFLIDFFGIEGGVLPHFQLVDGRSGSVIAADQPGLLGVPGVGFLFGPARRLRVRGDRAQAGGDKRCNHENDFEVFHVVNSARVYMLGVQDHIRNGLSARGYTGHDMTITISMLRAVNVGGHNKIKMDALRALYESLNLRDAQTYVQSGNVIFRTDERDVPRLAKRIEDAIERKFGFRPDVILRTAAEMREVIARNPFAKRRGIEPGKLLVSFLASDPGEEARGKVRQMKCDPEEMRIEGREIYIYFPNGAGRSKLNWAGLGKVLKTPATGRNWNSVTKMLEMAEKLEGSE